MADLRRDVDRGACRFERAQVAIEIYPRWLQRVSGAIHSVFELVARHPN